MAKIELPEEVRLRAEAGGEATRRWLNDLPQLVAGLEREWGIGVEPTALGGGSASYLCRAVTEMGAPAILKLTMPSEDITGEIITLERSAGRGYVRLLRHDTARGALLQERLGPALGAMGLPVDEQIQVICATLAQAWAPMPEPQGLMTGAEKAAWLAEFITRTWEVLDRPCSEAAVAQALACADSRAAAFDLETCVLVHGDAHSGNVLQAPDAPSGFKFVDPDGLCAEPACDLAIPMREWSAELLAGDALERGRARCARLAALTGVPFQAIWEWGVMERMSTGLLCTQLGYQPTGRDTLAVSDTWALSR